MKNLSIWGQWAYRRIANLLTPKDVQTSFMNKVKRLQLSLQKAGKQLYSI